jgi:iron complex outermembrane receptor protein
MLPATISGREPRRKRNDNSTIVCCAAAIALAVCASKANAQSVDYGSLEALFGEPVTTSVTGSPQRVSEAPATIVVITQDEIRRSGARDIPGILRHVPGVDVMQWTNDDADVGIRGYNKPSSPRLLVLVDGRQVYDDSYGETPWRAIPVELSDIRQIEIVYGPNSALFGFNAVGGVINIITYDPLYDDVNTVSATGGTQNLVQGSAVVTHQWGDWGGLRISGGGSSDADFSTPLQPIDIGSRQGDYRRSVDILGHAQLAEGIDASLELAHSEVALPVFVSPGLYYYAKLRTNAVKGRLAAETDAGLIEATAYFNTREDVSSIPWADNLLLGFKNSVYVVQIQDLYKPAPAHTIRVSFEYRHDDIPTTPLGGAEVFYDIFSGGAMWSWQIQPDLTLTNAVRADHLSLGRTGLIPPGVPLTNADWDRRSLTALSFNSAIVAQSDAVNTFRVSAARGAQLPNLINLGGEQVSTPAGYVGGLPTLDPSFVMNYELDWDRNIPAWNGQFHARLFHQTTDGIISDSIAAPPGRGILASPAVVADSAASGVELAIDATFAEQWRWGLSYTPETVSDHYLPGFTPENTLIDFADTHPDQVVDANLGWADGPWAIDGYLRYESEFQGLRYNPASNIVLPTATLVRIPDYVSVDANIAYRFDNGLTLSLSGQSLLQHTQMQTAAADVERRIYLTATVDF